MANMKKNNTLRIVVLSTLAGLTLVFLGAAIISFRDATTVHQNSHYMKMTRMDGTQESTVTDVVLPVETPTLSLTAPPPTLSSWEQVQQQVDTLRNHLPSGSDGYQSLTTALAEPEPNETWCSNLLIAIQDFNDINDTAGSEAIQSLADARGC